MSYKVKPVEDRLWPKVDKSGECWEWLASKCPRGYGRFTIQIDGKPKKALAHRFVYELVKGAIPAGMLLDHLCRNASCVNPDHLRPVTQKQNQEHRSGATSRSRSGVLGVSPYKDKWRAAVQHDGRFFHVGEYRTIAEAECAVIAKRNELYTHNDQDRRNAA